jgi:hypothetical protein
MVARGSRAQTTGQGQPAATKEGAPPAASGGASAPAPAPPPRKPHRQPPKPKLSKAALEGATPLRTFSELMAFYEAQKQSESPKTEPPEATADSPSTAAPQ